MTLGLSLTPCARARDGEVMFGQNVLVRRPRTLEVGAPVELLG